MLEVQSSAREIRRRLWNPPGGHESCERTEVISTAAARRRRIEAENARLEEMRRQEEAERRTALVAAIEAKEAERILAAQVASPDEVIPVVPKFSEIVRLVCAHFDVTHIDLISSRRAADIVRPRQVVVYLARHTTGLSLPQIGQRLGGRDHTTARSSVQKITRLLAEGDEKLAADIDHIKWELGVA